MFSNVTMFGRIANNIKYITNGSTTRAYFSIALQYKKDEDCNFISCSAYGKTADMIYKYFKKGKPIVIESGFLRTYYKDINGVKTLLTCVIVNKVGFTINDVIAEDSGDNQKPTPQEVFGLEETADDIPF